VAVATRLAERLATTGGWGDGVVRLPSGEWQDALTGRSVTTNADGEARLDALLTDLPVALLVRHGSLVRDEHA
jgi:(1->4)-alpha-D-glucan 1-alpha-D-glucosylmutase